MKILDSHLHDGVHELRDGERFVKEGDKLYLECTDTLAGRYVSRACVIPFARSHCLLQRCHSEQVRAQLLALHGLHARGGDHPRRALRALEPRGIPSSSATSTRSGGQAPRRAPACAPTERGAGPGRAGPVRAESRGGHRVRGACVEVAWVQGV